MAAPARKKYQDSRFSLGNATSLAPIMIGRKKFPNTAGRPGSTNMKIMMTPCTVKKALYTCGANKGGFRVRCSILMSTPIVTAMKKRISMEARYRIPILL
jgi:hypothetical protein